MQNEETKPLRATVSISPEMMRTVKELHSTGIYSHKTLPQFLTLLCQLGLGAYENTFRKERREHAAPEQSPRKSKIIDFETRRPIEESRADIPQTLEQVVAMLPDEWEAISGSLYENTHRSTPVIASVAARRTAEGTATEFRKFTLWRDRGLLQDKLDPYRARRGVSSARAEFRRHEQHFVTFKEAFPHLEPNKSDIAVLAGGAL